MRARTSLEAKVELLFGNGIDQETYLMSSTRAAVSMIGIGISTASGAMSCKRVARSEVASRSCESVITPIGSYSRRQRFRKLIPNGALPTAPVQTDNPAGSRLSISSCASYQPHYPEIVLHFSRSFLHVLLCSTLFLTALSTDI